MLAELRIENLAVISQAELRLSSGFNVITGETGAGKTILAHAISLILGARAGSGLIRPGAQEASVEAVFTVPPGTFADLAEEIDLPEGEDLIVRRRVSRDGKSRAYLGGRATTLNVLEQTVGRLLAFSAQHEQQRLMMASKQLDVLDAFGGARLIGLREEHEMLYARRRQILARLAELDRGSEAQAREAELLAFQAEEIEAAALSSGEDAALETEYARLSKAEELRESTASLAVLLGRETGAGLMDQLSAALGRLQTLAGVDAGLDAITGRLQTGFYDLEEIARSARDYSEACESDPARLAEVEERLGTIGQLKRKYGGSIEEINRHAARAREMLSLIVQGSESRSRLENELSDVERKMTELARELRDLRSAAAARLAQATEKHLGDLAFTNCGFSVLMMPLEGEGNELVAGACAPNGADAVEFYVRPNPGMPAAPIRQTASGGELSRIMLAVKSTISTQGESATLVFDEIDAGISGETGLAVGAKLKRLAESSQVICITHLPQIARSGDSHFTVRKTSSADSTATEVFLLNDEEIIDELCRMMGSSPDDSRARAHAISLVAGSPENRTAKKKSASKRSKAGSAR